MLGSPFRFRRSAWNLDIGRLAGNPRSFRAWGNRPFELARPVLSSRQFRTSASEDVCCAGMELGRTIAAFLDTGPWAVVGASRSRLKYGNKVLRCYLQHNRTAYPVNPHETRIEDVRCYPDLRHLPEQVQAISVITPPGVTEQIVEDAPASGARFMWMQPGAESPEAVARAEALGLTVISGGPCVLVALGFRDV